MKGIASICVGRSSANFCVLVVLWCGSEATAAVLLLCAPLPPLRTRRAKLLPCQTRFSWTKTAGGGASGFQPGFLKK